MEKCRYYFDRFINISIVMMIPSYIFSKYAGRYKLHKSQEKIYQFMYMGDIKLFAKDEK